jgi:hypothetical protein
MRAAEGVEPPFDAPALAAAVEAWVAGDAAAPPKLRLEAAVRPQAPRSG